MQMLILMNILYFRNLRQMTFHCLASTDYEDYLMIISSYVMIMIDDHSIMICYDNNDHGNNNSILR